MRLIVIIEFRDYCGPLFPIKIFGESIKIWVNPLTGALYLKNTYHVSCRPSLKTMDKPGLGVKMFPEGRSSDWEILHS